MYPLYFDCVILLPSPTFARVGDGAVVKFAPCGTTMHASKPHRLSSSSCTVAHGREGPQTI